jgi:CDP-glucose 4,6-dehydratase
MLSEVYAGKRIVVTGHSGFKGSWLSLILDYLNAKVFGFSKDVPANIRHAYYSLDVQQVVQPESVINGDVASQNFQFFLDDVKPDFIFHLAGQAVVKQSYEYPRNTFLTNTFGVLNLLEYLRTSTSVIPTVIVTSDKCYENTGAKHSYHEGDRLGGSDPYSSSKAAAEILYEAYLKSFFLGASKGVATARAGNVFGGGDCADFRLIPDCINSIFDSQKINLRMPGATRPWTYVIDVLHGYLLLGKHLSECPNDFAGAWNFAADETLTVIELAQILANSMKENFGEIEISHSEGSFKEHNLLQLNAKKANKNLGWFPKESIHDSIEETAEWYLRQKESRNLDVFNRSILEKYFA